MNTTGQATKNCAKCGNPSTDFLRIDPGMRLRIKETIGDEGLPPEVCPTCFKGLSASVSRGAKLRAEQHVREQNKLIMWKNRVNLVKQGRRLLQQKAYSEAAVAFEKYLRVLEVVHDKKPGELTPEVFKDAAQTKEITVVASVLWDLVRIYDMTPRYGDRQKKAIDKLIAFLKLSPLQSEIMRKARQFEASAKNSSLIKDFIKRADRHGGKCFIATATYQGVLTEEVLVFYAFRDDVLSKSVFGQAFIKFYYFASPPIAKFVASSNNLRAPLKKLFAAIAPWLKKTFNLQP